MAMIRYFPVHVFIVFVFQKYNSAHIENMSVSSTTLPVPEFIYCYNDDHSRISQAPSNSLLLEEDDDYDDTEIQENSNYSSKNDFDNGCEKVEKSFDVPSNKTRRYVEDSPDHDCSSRKRQRLSSFSPSPPPVDGSRFQRRCHATNVAPRYHHNYPNDQQNQMRPDDGNHYGRLSSGAYNPYMPAKLQNCNNHYSSTRQINHFQTCPVPPRNPYRQSNESYYYERKRPICSSQRWQQCHQEQNDVGRNSNQNGYHRSLGRKNSQQQGYRRDISFRPHHAYHPFEHYWRQQSNKRWNGRGYPPQEHNYGCR